MIVERLLAGPGPSNPYPEATAGLVRPIVGHLDPTFLDLLDETSERLRRVFRTSHRLTFPLSGTGSAGMEAGFVNLLEPGEVAIVGVNGLFGERMCEVARRCGAEVVRVEAPWGKALDPQQLLDAHRCHQDARLLAVVHAETSTGVRNDLAPLARLQDSATLLLVDAVTSLGGIEVEVDAWGVDFCYSGTQKCLGAPPGLAPLAVSDRALERVRSRRQPCRSWYLDLELIADYVGSARRYHHTAPVAMVASLHGALGVILEEGLEEVWKRHQEAGDFLHERLAALGFSLFAEAGYRLPQLTTVVPPVAADADAIRRALLERYGIEVGAGVGPLAGQVWRIGLMGHTARRRSVTALVGALEDLMTGTGQADGSA